MLKQSYELDGISLYKEWSAKQWPNWPEKPLSKNN